MSKKVLLILASEGFQVIEYGHTKEELEEAGFEVVVASDKAGEIIGGDEKTKAKADLSLDEINLDDYDGLYIIGGPGAKVFLDNEKLYNLLSKWKETGKPYGAICWSVRILAKAGVLKDKIAAGWNGDGELPEILEKNGAKYIEEDAHTDGSIVTASGPGAAREFGRMITEQF
jgi:putative intracellular protease/amidase